MEFFILISIEILALLVYKNKAVQNHKPWFVLHFLDNLNKMFKIILSFYLSMYQRLTVSKIT